MATPQKPVVHWDENAHELPDAIFPVFGAQADGGVWSFKKSTQDQPGMAAAHASASDGDDPVEGADSSFVQAVVSLVSHWSIDPYLTSMAIFEHALSWVHRAVAMSLHALSIDGPLSWPASFFFSWCEPLEPPPPSWSEPEPEPHARPTNASASGARVHLVMFRSDPFRRAMEASLS
jgi:hypothetical protein